MNPSYPIPDSGRRSGETLRRCETAIREDLHVFQAAGRWLAYGRVSGALMDITPSEAAVLRQVIEDGDHDTVGPRTASLDAYAATLRRTIERISRQKVSREGLGTVRAFLVLVTDACNLACTYCYCHFGRRGPAAHMSEETAESVVLAARDLGIGRLVFFGGEPLLNFSAVRGITARAASLGLKLEYGMTTNATLVTEDIAQDLRRWGVRVSVSIDGPPEVHNLTRVYPGGAGSYDDVLRGIEILMKHDLLALVEVTHSARHPADLGRILGHMETLGVPVTCTCVDGLPCAPYAGEIVGGERIKRYYDELVPKVFEDLAGAGECSVSGVAELVAAVLSPVSVHRPHICGGVAGRAAIAPDGRVYPCPETMEEGYSFGSVRDPGFAEAFEERRKTALSRLSKGPALERLWFANLVDTCIVRLTRDDVGNFVLRQADEISDCLEHAVGLIAVQAERAGLGPAAFG